MTPRRSRLDVQLDVLTAVREGVDKTTRIMYATHTAWNSVRKILDSLVDGGLLSVILKPGGIRAKRRYEITEKGISVLNYFESAKELVDFV